MTPQYLHDMDRQETQEWLDSIRSVLNTAGPERASFLLNKLTEWGKTYNLVSPSAATTPYVNTIRVDDQPEYPGDRRIERRLKSIMRWNAMAMVVRANRAPGGVGGHISTFASAATLWQVGFNHFFKANTKESPGDQIFFQGHASPGIYARAYMERRLNETQLINFRRELADGGGLSSYPHPWLMPDFWEFPTVSMGLNAITAIYQARFNHYLRDRGLKDTSGSHVWSFLGDGEMDEPESMGAITLAGREGLNNLIFVINCNLQRLDGPVRGNGNMVQELEGAFRGAGWNVVKVLWGDDWDPLLKADKDGVLVDRMNETIDGERQKYSVEDGAYTREHFFGTDERLLKMVEHLSDGEIRKLRMGGHDPEKVYAAYKAAVEQDDAPTVILARTIKGYGLGEVGEGRNTTHQQKKLDDEELRQFRDRFDIPISDKDIDDTPFYRPPLGSPEYEYLIEQRRKLGGFVPRRRVYAQPLEPLSRDTLKEFYQGSGQHEVATTMAFVRMLSRLMDDKQIGKYVVPIIPDEARTFGMDALFRKYGIYAHAGQKYEPVDSHLLLYYRETKDGQILEEGITEAGSMASFTAAGMGPVTFGVNTIPFFMFYSMFGFQRIGDSAWAAADARARGFMIGCTAGRTALNGEGLQHQDGHSHVLASTFPNIQAYDPAFAYEVAIIVLDGIKRMYCDREPVYYYMTLYNEVYQQAPMPEGVEEGILKGLYKFQRADNPDGKPRVHLFGSGPILREALKAQEVLDRDYGVAADVWSATSYTNLRREALKCERWNRLHPNEAPQIPYVQAVLQDEPWPIVTTSDYMKSWSDKIARWVPAGVMSLGTDGFGRSDTREALRDFFEIDYRYVAVAALTELAKRGEFPHERLDSAINELGIDRDKVSSKELPLPDTIGDEEEDFIAPVGQGVHEDVSI